MIEDQKTISLWAASTFGPAKSPLRVCWRAMEEMAEAGRKQSAGGSPEEIGDELADVAIVLFRLATLVQVDLIAGQAKVENPNLPNGDHVAISIALAARHLTNASYFLGRGMANVGTPYELLRIYRWLDRAARLMDFDLRALIDTKMVVNRKREWAKTADGHGYHIRDKGV